ncbi:MAG: hypothetical protein QUU85_14855, partial [Candidatus Eisenbacteria bacterium]|nr:hypothetical protein [Candidatus Eisenbacteria bacterium]
MDRNPVNQKLGRRTILWASLLPAFVVAGTLTTSPAIASAYRMAKLVSDIPGEAAVTDSNLVNPWGVAYSATGPFWVSDNGTGLSTVYDGAGQIQALVVTVPPAAGEVGPSTPTGICLLYTSDAADEFRTV